MYKIEKKRARSVQKKPIYILCLFVCFLFVSNKRKNAQTHRAQILCGTSHDRPREGLLMVKILKISLQQNTIFIKF